MPGVKRVYFDHNATTPLDPRVREAMLPWFGETYGNPASVHAFGQAARNAVEEARERVALLLGASPPEVVFTASATEGNNTVLFSVARQARFRGRVVISAFEHPSIRGAAALLEEAGMEVARVEPDRDGRVSAATMLAAVDGETRLVCLLLAQNEVGTLQPVAEVAAACRERGVPMLCDAAQAVGKVPVRLADLGVDYLTVAGHKFHGPIGAAALWVRGGMDLLPLLVGGSHERRRRASTVNVAAVVGFGRAADLAAAEVEERGRLLAAIRDRFEAGLAAVADVAVHGREAPRLPNTSNVAFAGVEGHALVIRLDLEGYAVSAGSACSSGAPEPSVSLQAMGLPREETLSSLRVSFGCTNTLDEVDPFVEALARQVAALRRTAPAAAAGP